MWGLVARLDISDDNSRRMILRKLAEDRQIILPEEVTGHLLMHLPRDITALAEALDRMSRSAQPACGQQNATASALPMRIFRPGWQEGIRLSKEMGLYRQQYCGYLSTVKKNATPRSPADHK